MSSTLSVRRGFSSHVDSATAFHEVVESISQPDISVVILFISSHFDLDILAKRIAETYHDTPVIACTTAGEISPLVYPERSISATSIASTRLSVTQYLIEELQHFSVDRADSIGQEIGATHQERCKTAPETQVFGLLLIDGLSISEENVAANLYGALGGIPFVGGSAGDDLRFEETHVYHDGAFHAQKAVFSAFFTDHPFKVFKTQHFEPVEEAKMVITEAETEKRVVREINGYPAAEEYARFVGLEVSELEPMVFSRHPVMLRIGGDYYVRSIQKVNEDGTLTFFCAIDEGLVLTLAQGVDMMRNLQQAFTRVEEEIEEPKVVIGCECILRRLEILERGLQGEAARIMENHQVIGFHTYGEQYNGLHINQTFTAIALGES